MLFAFSHYSLAEQISTKKMSDSRHVHGEEEGS
jgi:hypothetical protein